jgi:hypothetical protein
MRGIASFLAAGTALACSTLAGFEKLNEGGEGGAPDAEPNGGTSLGGALVAANGGGGEVAQLGTAGAGQSGAGHVNPPAGSGGGGALAGATSGEGGTAGEGGALGPGGGCATQQLLRNSNFDVGKMDWLEKSTYTGLSPIVRADDPNLQREGVAPHSGSYLAWLGGITVVTNRHHFMSVEQEVAIPLEATEIVITGQLAIATLEEGATVYDEGHVRLYDGGVLVWAARTWTNLDVSEGWLPFEIRQPALLSLAGRTLIFRIESDTDERNPTSFWFDSLRLEARCSPPGK